MTTSICYNRLLSQQQSVKMAQYDTVYFIVARYGYILPLSFRVTSLALGQSYDCPSACEATLKDMHTKFTGNHKELVVAQYIIYGTYC